MRVLSQGAGAEEVGTVRASDFPIDRVERRYMTDAPFRNLVDSMVNMSLQLRFSPGELREAAVFAEIRVEMLRATPSFFYRREPEDGSI